MLTGTRVPLAVASLVSTYADWGRTDDARALYQELIDRTQREYVQPTALVYAATALGQLDAAIGFARQARDDQDPLLTFLGSHFPDLSILRERAEFHLILATVSTSLRRR